MLAKLDGEREEQIAATHIRMMRDQAAEMLFALLAAAIQAPTGVVLWLLAYRTDELDQVIAGFNCGASLLTVSGRRKYDWVAVAREVTQRFRTEKPADLDEYIKQHASFWRRLALEYMDPIARKEYGGLKHGLRVAAGGCEITLTPEVSPGVKDPTAKPSVLTGSGFGGGFYVAERIGSQKIHYRLVHHHRHWTPSSLLLQLDLIVNSAQNVVKHLLLANGLKETLNWMRPTDDGIFEACWQTDGSLRASHFGPGINEGQIGCLTEAELIAHCHGAETLP